MVCYTTKCVTSALFTKRCHATASMSPVRRIKASGASLNVTLMAVPLG